MKKNQSLSRHLEYRYRLMVLPALILIFGLILFPLLYNFYISFTNYSLLKRATSSSD